MKPRPIVERILTANLHCSVGQHPDHRSNGHHRMTFSYTANLGSASCGSPSAVWLWCCPNCPAMAAGRESVVDALCCVTASTPTNELHNTAANGKSLDGCEIRTFHSFMSSAH